MMKYSDFKLFFGDLHGHSNISKCGVCIGRTNVLERDCYIHSSLINEFRREFSDEETVDIFYDFAKNKAKLDFAVLTDHDYDLSDELWDFVCKKAEEWYSPGSFVTLPAYEWTSYAYGHRNVYYLNPAPIFRCVEYGHSPYREKGYSPRDLWEFLRKRGIKAITIPHHPSLTQFFIDWNYYNPEFDRAVEIVSIWGVFEYYNNPYYCLCSNNLPRHFVMDALEMGYKLGIVGGGDTHDCLPSSSFRNVIIKNYMGGKVNSLTQFYVPYFVYNPLGSGITAIYAKELTREALFEALYQRRVYALVGVRAKLEFSIDGRLMGEEIITEEINYMPEIEVRVESEKNITKIEIIKNGRVFYRKFCNKKTSIIKIIDEEKPQRKINYYYVRITHEDGTKVWSSPIWVIYKKLPKIETEIRKKSVILRTINGVLRKVNVLAFLQEPLEYSSKPSVLEQLEKVCAIWVEKGKEYDLILKLRFKSSNEPLNFKGSLKLSHPLTYTVKPINFAITKYSGDLFTDDYNGYIEWDITPSSKVMPLDNASIKGLDIPIRINPLKKLTAEIEVYINGEVDLLKTYVFNNRVNDFPIKLELYNPQKAAWSKNIPVPSSIRIPIKGKAHLIIYPAYYDEKGPRYLYLTL